MYIACIHLACMGHGILKGCVKFVLHVCADFIPFLAAEISDSIASEVCHGQV